MILTSWTGCGDVNSEGFAGFVNFVNCATDVHAADDLGIADYYYENCDETEEAGDTRVHSLDWEMNYYFECYCSVGLVDSAEHTHFLSFAEIAAVSSARLASSPRFVDGLLISVESFLSLLLPPYLTP